MVRWGDIPVTLQESIKKRQFKPFRESAWTEAPKLTGARVAVVTTAAIHRADDRPFTGHEGDYRVIPGDIDYADLAMTHSSINFDRSAYQQDVNVCFPLERLRALADSGEIGSVSDWHYSFMGSTAPERMEMAAREVSGMLRGDKVNLVLLIPV
ncbi:MAG: selenoprotein B glycine/betaine/sarcosine/D-proline reductase [Chloroflexi bacterium]|nr:selenoprotein B glycine/betaine/sarcosine/D-proline reductase [Chloroflexota bacterium]